MAAKITDKSLWNESQKTTEKIALAAFLAVVLLGSETPARASLILQNGTFTSSSGVSSPGGGLNSDSYTTGGTLSNWSISNVSSSTGLVFLYDQGNQGSTTTNGAGVTLNGRFGSFSIYDPGNVAGSTPTGGAIPNSSPGGGNFIAADGATGYNVAIYQPLTNLTAGTVYAVSFYYAAGQQSNRTGTTTEGWQVSLTDSAETSQVSANGTTIQDTPAQSGSGLAQGSFQAWVEETFDFTASSAATQYLTFLSMGTPSGEPPVVLLSDVTMVSTPEPSSLAIFAIGMALLIGLLRFRRKRIRKAALSSQII